MNEVSLIIYCRTKEKKILFLTMEILLQFNKKDNNECLLILSCKGHRYVQDVL